MSGTRAISTTSRGELSSSFFFSEREVAEGNSRHSDRNIVSFLIGLRTYQHACTYLVVAVISKKFSGKTFTLLGCYAAQGDIWLPTFRDSLRSHLQGTAGLFENGTDRLSRNVDTNYDPTLYEVPAERNPQPHRGERL